MQVSRERAGAAGPPLLRDSDPRADRPPLRGEQLPRRDLTSEGVHPQAERTPLHMQAELEELQSVRRYEGELERNYQDSLAQVAELKQAHSRISLDLKAAREQLVSFEDTRGREAEAERVEGERRSAAFAQL
jgi:hypothetical protein